jgi:hypothetical protein
MKDIFFFPFALIHHQLIQPMKEKTKQRIPKTEISVSDLCFAQAQSQRSLFRIHTFFSFFFLNKQSLLEFAINCLNTSGYLIAKALGSGKSKNDRKKKNFLYNSLKKKKKSDKALFCWSWKQTDHVT